MHKDIAPTKLEFYHRQLVPQKKTNAGDGLPETNDFPYNEQKTDSCIQVIPINNTVKEISKLLFFQH